MDDQSRQMKVLILIAAVLCAVIIGYNAFYVPDASFAEPAVTADTGTSGSTGSEEYVPLQISSAAPSQRTADAAASSAAVRNGVSSAGKVSSGKSGASSAAPGGKINVNTATAQQLSDGLPGVGDTIAGRIVAYREQHGPFQSIDGLKNVAGIGDKKFAEIQSSITVG